MATVEQRDTQSAGLATLSNSLDIFNDFKDDKDSDEESFHLPLLDCDDDNDDLDSNNKDGVTSETTSSSDAKDTQCQNGESEDDILNKFETHGTPDIDPKIEDKLLDDIDDLCENNLDDVNAEKVSAEIDTLDKESNQETQCTDEKEETSEKDTEKSVIETKEIGTDKQTVEELSANKIEVTEFKAISDESEKVNNEHQETAAQNATEDSRVIEDEKMEVDENLIADEEKLLQEDEGSDETDQMNKNRSEDAKVTEGLENDTNISEVTENNENKAEDINEISEKDIEDIPTKNFNSDNAKNEVVATAGVEDITQKECQEVVQVNETTEGETLHLADKDVLDKDVNKLTEEDVVKDKKEVQIESKSSEKMDVDSVEPETGNNELEINNSQVTSNQVENITENNEKLDSKTECMDTEVIDSNENKELKTDEKDNNDDNKEDCTKENVTNNVLMESTTTECEKSEEKLLENNRESNSAASNQKESAVLTEPVKQQETDHSKTENVGPDKCENSNDSSKSQNLECDDLLDISIIRDADEDNASAIAENANDAHSSEKSDNEDQDEGSEKADNELDETEMDQEESLLATDKDDNMDFEDGNSTSLADQENTDSNSTSDSENKDDTDMGDSENDSNVSSALKEKTNKINENATDGENIQTDEVRTEPKDDSTKSTVTDDQDTVKENSLKSGGKRPISETENDTEAANKKIKLSENEIVPEKKKSRKVKTLLTFERYMQNKKLENKLTRSDLEQFCLQKICEAIMHKTDVGELHQTIKKQELIIENLRKDLQQLTKQTRDLDIVNKKLMNELRTQNGIKKPLVPLKITRSVGLQVKLNINVENNSRRKTPVVTNSRTPTPNTTPRQRTIPPANAGVVRQVATSPRKTPTTTTTTTPLLSQALQNNRQVSPANVTKRPPIRPKPAEPQKPNNPGVIDLTDEDDKASKTTKTPTATPVKIINKTIPISQAKTINIIPTKTPPNKTTNTNNQNKTIAVGQVKSSTVTTKVTTPTRTVTTLPQGVRLTPTQVKNGSITIPASVVTSSSGTTQLMYVVQPTSSLGQVVTSTAGGTQKAVLLNFQPTNGVLTSALNGSAVSVIPTKTTNTVQLKTVAIPRKHPAPLPTPPAVAVNASLKPLLPKPHLSIRKTDTGIILQWRMPYNLEIYEGIASYQLFAYQETNAAPSTDMWRKVGDVKALALPMACTLTQFADKNKYYFAVRSVDVHKRIGAFSDPEEISL